MTDVIVVGAGPVGLAAALALRARGLPATVLEADPEERIRPGSRALYVHRESLRLLDRISPGLGTEIAAHGVVWDTRRTLYRGREVYCRVYPAHRGELPPFTSLRQIETERLLRVACAAAGVTFHWGSAVFGVETAGRSVSLTTLDSRRWTADFVVAADGARSAIRRGLAIPLAGSTSEGFHVVVDVADDEPALERTFHYEHPGVGGRSVLTVPFAGGFQVDLQCRDDDDPADFGSAEAVRRWLPSVVGDRPAHRILWVSTYHFRQLVADRFTDPSGRVLLVGEAAHLFPPFGARGMNSGFVDADAAAEAVVNGTVAEFATARRAAALANSAAAGTALRHLRPRHGMLRFRQRAAAALAPAIPRFGSWLEHAPYGPRTHSTAKY